MEVDLHIHTTASDGTFSPREIIEMAVKKKMKAIAITDHDNVDGLKEANYYANLNNLELVNGIEFSCSSGNNEVHILGYFLNLEDKVFLERVQNLLKSRDERNQKIIEKLNKNGIIIDIEDVKKETAGNLLGRVHFANALIKKGYCKNIDEAFEKFLGKNGLAYEPRLNCPPEIVVAFIKENGAFSSLAHPKLISTDDNFVLNLIAKLKEYGLNGLEANYSSFTNKEKQKYKSWAKKFNLIVTGGSDFHGDNRKNLALGQEGLNYEQFKKIKDFIKN
ncbi:PHP domain-containing protein [Fusobacterium russii]|uniref:PHP domain-containing protein n=1 Tax=Fusobacterium russii TaxID=854 RepID=UPI00039A99EF|nr:PHP domain-containing protein [Fusobacterium russii]